MKVRSFISLLLAGTSLAAFSHPLLDEAQRLAADAPSTPATAECANFAGHWQGTCRGTGAQNQSDDLVVEQNGCTYLKSGGLNLSLTGLSSETNTATVEGKATTSTFAVASAWNDDRSAVEATYGGMARSSDGKPVAFTGKAIMRLENGKLHTELTGVNYNLVCDYQRQ